VKAVAVGLIGLVGLAYVGTWASGYSVAVNPSVSMPRGLYLLKPVGDLSRGAVVAACIPNRESSRLYVERGYLPESKRCPSGAAPVIKPIVAGPGDRVTLDDDGVTINGMLVAYSEIDDEDSKGRPMPHVSFGDLSLGNDQFFLLATHAARSLDSRYFGPIRDSDVIAQVSPLVTE
jgi:conjugative transfer signal peptidase TraF